GRQAAIGSGMGRGLEYFLIRWGGGFGMAIVAMVGTNWGASQYRRAREVAWGGGATVAAVCAAIGLIVAVFPHAWMNLFTTDQQIVGIGAWDLQILGPIYGFARRGRGHFFLTPRVCDRGVGGA